MRSFFFKREMCESCPHSSPMLSHFYPWGEKVGYPSRSDAVPGLEGLVAEILIATFTVNSTKKPSWVIPVYTRTFQTSRCPTQKSFLTCWFQSFPIISNHKHQTWSILLLQIESCRNLVSRIPAPGAWNMISPGCGETRPDPRDSSVANTWTRRRWRSIPGHGCYDLEMRWISWFYMILIKDD